MSATDTSSVRSISIAIIIKLLQLLIVVRFDCSFAIPIFMFFFLHMSALSCSNHSWVSFQGFSAAYNDYVSNISTHKTAEEGICFAISIKSRRVQPMFQLYFMVFV